jgi:hypothetical protein
MNPRRLARTAINGAAIALWCVAAAVALVLFGCTSAPVEAPPDATCSLLTQQSVTLDAWDGCREVWLYSACGPTRCVVAQPGQAMVVIQEAHGPISMAVYGAECQEACVQ